MARRAKAYLSDKKTAEQIADTLAAPTRAIAPYDGGRIAILVRFELDSAEIVPGEALTLDRVALSLTDPRIAGKTILVEGHTCSRGDSLHNLELSRKRAEAVRQALIRRGVDPARLKIQGFGEDRPIRPNDSEENQAANRRVEFVRID